MDTDNDIQALKEEVEELKAMTADTNRQVHKMRRAAWWGRLWAVVWWLTIFGVSGAAYYYYAQPYVAKLQQYYANFQQHSSQAADWEQQAQQFFATYFSPQKESSTPAGQ